MENNEDKYHQIDIYEAIEMIEKGLIEPPENFKSGGG